MTPSVVPDSCFNTSPSVISKTVAFFPTGMTCGDPALKCRMFSNRNYSLSTSSGGPRSIQPRRELYTELSGLLLLYLSNDKCKRQSAISKASTRSRTMTQRSNKKQTGLL
ncbi:unnamed protein product [Clavelina lepadiformis]|uniref:Uncharacterized protein n=1 Tax=Clavelina lepadiformis TaxID=159417 RepID=A0ABP0GIZ8_CLALP